MADKFQLKAILSAVDKITPVLKNVSRAAKISHKSIRDIGNAGGELMRKIGLPAIASFSAITFAATNAGKAAIDYAGSIQDASDRTGESVENFQSLANMLIQNGGQFEDAEVAATKFNKGIAEAAAGGDKSFLALMRKMKIPLKDAHGNLQQLSAVLPDLADRFSKTKDPALRTRMAMELFGKSGTRLLPILMRGKDGVQELQDEFRKMGSIVSQADIEALDEIGDGLDRIGIQVRSNLASGFAKLLPVITPIIQQMVDWITVNKEWLQQQIVSTVTGLIDALRSFDWAGAARDIRDAAKSVNTVIQMLGGLKMVLIGMGLAFIAGPIAAIFTIIGSVGRLVFALVTLVGGWGAVGAILLKVGGFALSLLKIILLIGRAMLTLSAAILATPIGIILALATAAYLVYKNWDKIKQWFSDFVTWIGPQIKKIADWFKGLVPDWVKNMFGGGATVNINSNSGSVTPPGALAASQKQQLNGDMTVRFENAPQGMRVDQGKTNNPGVGFNADVGYRSLAFSL